MCGVAGIVNLSHEKSPVNLATRVRSMCDLMVHRGPDSSGVWRSADGRVALGHRRLTIIDLSRAADQPMSDAQGEICVTFNGEIYNHEALRRGLQNRGHRFTTDHSDTEVLIHGYREWGINGLVERLEGMCAFGLWDTKNNNLFLVRDRFGIKPIYFSIIDNFFVFSSEIKPILDFPGFVRDIDQAALSHYVSFMVSPTPLTLFKGIFKVPAATILRVEEDGATLTERYWDVYSRASPVVANRNTASGAGVSGEIMTRLSAAVEKRMVADVPVGAFLSSGIDSSIVVALMSRMGGGPIPTFSLGYRDFPHLNELEGARRTAEYLGCDHNEVVIDEDDAMDCLEHLFWHHDEPCADWASIPSYFLARAAHRNGLKVVQIGEGADEQFAGYTIYPLFHRLQKTGRAVLRHMPRPAVQLSAHTLNILAAVSGMTRLRHLADILGRAQGCGELFWGGSHAVWDVDKARLLRLDGPEGRWLDLERAGIDMAGYETGGSGEVVARILRDFDQHHPEGDDLDRMIYLDMAIRLSDLLLARVDRMTMASSVEARVPYLDHDLVEFVMGIPSAMKLTPGNPKGLLRNAAKGLLPADVLSRDKKGFGVPVAEWMKGKLGNHMESRIKTSELCQSGLIDGETIGGYFRNHRSGRENHAVPLWVLFVLAGWHERWIVGR
jgi:asparagine synthase (glutamine-hydrolysing)